MNKKLEFKDLGFKLAVVNELMYIQDVLKPQMEVYKFIGKKRNLTETEVYDIIDEEGYEVIPEILEYFKDLKITSEMVQNIEELCTDGGNDIYLQIIPFWNGEDDTFNIKSADDVDLLPSLKEVTIFYDEDDSILSEFKKKGIKAEWL